MFFFTLGLGANDIKLFGKYLLTLSGKQDNFVLYFYTFPHTI
jgi:hypothetical protein